MIGFIPRLEISRTKIVSGVGVLVAVLALFGVDMPAEQQASMVAFIVALSQWFVRDGVTRDLKAEDNFSKTKIISTFQAFANLLTWGALKFFDFEIPMEWIAQGNVILTSIATIFLRDGISSDAKEAGVS